MIHFDENEVRFEKDQLIVSMTDPKGRITYVNDIFITIAGYEEEALLGQPHNIIRHPDMPKAVFKLLWDTAGAGESIYAFVKNLAHDGRFYWVKAFVIPVYKDGVLDHLVSYRKPVSDYAKGVMGAIYAQVVEYEKTHSVDESLAFLVQFLSDRNLSYHQFVDRLSKEEQVLDVDALNIDIGHHHDAHMVVQANIKNRVAHGEKNIEVVDSCCCEFGKWCESAQGKAFTKHSSWKKVLQHHDKMHQGLKEYVKKANIGANEAILNQIDDDIHTQTKQIFISLEDVISHWA